MTETGLESLERSAQSENSNRFRSDAISHIDEKPRKIK